MRAYDLGTTLGELGRDSDPTEPHRVKIESKVREFQRCYLRPLSDVNEWLLKWGIFPGRLRNAHNRESCIQLHQT